MNNLNINEKGNITKNTFIEIINIYKNTSLPRVRKGCYQFLHVLEPLGIELINSTKIGVTIEGTNISGFATLYIHNTDDIKKLRVIRVGVKRTVTISDLGEIFLDIDQVIFTPNNDVKFNFSIKLEFDTNSYIKNPIFDIRTNKISKDTIDDEITFKQEVRSFSNNEHGMLMISENVRVYMPKSKYIPIYFSPTNLLELYEKIIQLYNKLAGFDYNSPNKLLEPRKQFVLISARNNHLEFASAGSTMMDTAPNTSRFYFMDGWGLFHEFAHLFEGFWSVTEIWTNMYSKYIAERTSDGFFWLWQGSYGIDREIFEKNNIKILYEKYFINNHMYKTKLTSKIGLYFFISLEEALGANFVTTIEKYARYNPPMLTKLEYIIYSISKNYNINIIPFAQMYGQQINNQNLIDEIIDNSNKTFFYIPKNKMFNPYRYISVPVTLKRIYIKDKTINGISNINSIIKIKIKSNIYTMHSDSNGKFNFKIPINIDLTDEIIITSEEVGKSESMPKIFYLSNGLSDNSLTFIGINNILIAKIDFDIKNKRFLVTSTGKKPNLHLKGKEYFIVRLKDSNGYVKFRVAIKSDQSADNFKYAIDPQYFEYNDVLELFSIAVGHISITNYNGQKIYYNKNKTESFRITENGLI